MKPDTRAIDQFLVDKNGNYRKIHSNFSFYMKKYRAENNKQPWFGKICLLQDGTVYDLEECKDLYKVDTEEFENFNFVDKHIYIAFYHDWSAFDELGAYDESYHCVCKDSYKVARTNKYIYPVYDKDKNLKEFATSSGETWLTAEDFENGYKRKIAKEKLNEVINEQGLI